MLRTHDVVLVDGTFRLVLTPRQRVVAVLDVETSPLGPLHIAMNVDRAPYLPPGLPPKVLLDPFYVEQGRHEDAGRAVRRAARDTFDVASEMARSVAAPAIEITQAAASEGAHIVGGMPAMSPHHHHAAHLVFRIRLGDLNAKALVRGIVRDAKAGVKVAQHMADALLDASKFVAKVADAPMLIASQIPGAKGVVASISPFEHFQKMITAVQHGNFKEIEKILKTDLSMAQGVVSMIPGVGTGVSAAISAGLAVLEGAKGIGIALKTAYGLIPIPAGIRQVTDIVMDTVVAFIEHPHKLTDVAIQVARDRIPSGIPRDVFDTLIHVVVKHVPIQKEAGALIGHYVKQYAPMVADHAIGAVLNGLKLDPSLLNKAVSQIAPHVHVDPSLLKQVGNIARVANIGGAAGRMVQPLFAAGA